MQPHSNAFTLDKFFLFRATQKTKRQKKRFCAKISQNPFVYCFLLSSCPASPRAPGFGACVAPVILPSSTECDIREAKRTATDPLDGQSKDLKRFLECRSLGWRLGMTSIVLSSCHPAQSSQNPLTLCHCEEQSDVTIQNRAA